MTPDLFIRHQSLAETFSPAYAMAVHQAIRDAKLDLRDPDACATYVVLLIGA